MSAPLRQHFVADNAPDQGRSALIEDNGDALWLQRHEPGCLRCLDTVYKGFDRLAARLQRYRGLQQCPGIAVQQGAEGL